jgi:hypothetical protein
MHDSMMNIALTSFLMTILSYFALSIIVKLNKNSAKTEALTFLDGCGLLAALILFIGFFATIGSTLLAIWS